MATSEAMKVVMPSSVTYKSNKLSTLNAALNIAIIARLENCNIAKIFYSAFMFLGTCLKSVSQ